MKIIDLLNKIANDKNFRPTVKFLSTTYTYDKTMNNYKNDQNFKWGLFSDYTINNILNDEAELIEENKEIEEYETEYTERRIDIEVRNKINEVVKAVNKLIKESEEK